MMFFAPFALAACLTLPPGAVNITAADLHLDGVAPTTIVSPAPAPGYTRTFLGSELRQLAARFHLASVPDEPVCLERAVAPLDPAKLLTSMQKELPGAKIEILDFGKQPAPLGEMKFRASGLRRNALSNEATWFGAIRYAPNREFTIWAHVRVTAQVARVIAVSDLAGGKPVEAAQIRLETRDEFPSTVALADSLEEVLGRYPRMAIRAGAEIRRDALEAPKDVRQGDVVEVIVNSGAAHLKFEARAESSGSAGDTISVRNPTSTRRFQAKIEGKDKVLVEAKNLP
jgi:flagella basal body P-ring formation protein FlgA